MGIYFRKDPLPVIKKEVALLEKQMRELFFKMPATDNVVALYKAKLNRRNELLKHLPKDNH